MSAYYFSREPPTPPLLLRRTDTADEAFLSGKWQRTHIVIDYMAGNDDNVSELTERAARAAVPAAFTS